MRKPVLLVAVVLMLGLAPAPAPKPVHPDPSKEDLKQMQGTWVRTVCADCLVGDEPVLVAEDGDVEVVIAGDRMTFTCPPTSKVAGVFTITVDASKKPKAIDMRGVGVDSGKQVRGIYSVNGDTLKLGTPLVPQGARPTTLNSVHPGQRHEVFKRKKR